jgi:large subunit ribosomal protein L4
VSSVLVNDINTYDIMNADVLVFTENTTKVFHEEEAGAVA